MFSVSKTPDYPYLRSSISYLLELPWVWVGTSARVAGVSLLFLKNSTATAPVMTPTCPESAIRKSWPYKRFSSCVRRIGWGLGRPWIIISNLVHSVKIGGRHYFCLTWLFQWSDIWRWWGMKVSPVGRRSFFFSFCGCLAQEAWYVNYVSPDKPDSLLVTPACRFSRATWATSYKEQRKSGFN